MSPLVELIIVAIFAVFVAGITGNLVYKYTGWIPFTINKGQNFSYDPKYTDIIGKIAFKDCILALNGADGSKLTHNVTSVLDGMTAAYIKNTNPEFKFKLDDPGLSAYSFQVPGFNDQENHPDTTIWGDNVEETKVTLTGFYKVN